MRTWDDTPRATPRTIQVTPAGQGYELRCERTGQWATADKAGHKLSGNLTSAKVQAAMLRYRDAQAGT